MAQFIDAKDTIVTDAIDGLLRGSGGRLARLDGYPHVKVVLRADGDDGGVALISGGGSGHEPAHAGFVGPGMLTAAVCGEVFASPSVDAVLAGILAVTGEAGCLLIVKNYTGDRLNFGLAAERARAMGKRVEMVVVDDDVALPDLPQARGVAGTLFVHKIAGHLARSGADLDTVAAAARDAVDRMASIGMSLSTCTVPGSAREDRIPAGKAELGLGIHGEPGVDLVDHDGARAAIDALATRLLPHLGEGGHVALLNNLGATTPLEMAILTEALARSELGGRLTHLIGPAPMMTSLDMHGVSLSVLPAEGAVLDALTAEVPLAAWPGCHPLGAPEIRAMPDGMAPQTFDASADPARRAVLDRACDVLIAAEGDLNALDAKSGDGDTGATLATAARALKDRAGALPLGGPHGPLMRAIGQELSQTMGGSSGVLLAILFSAAGEAAEGGADLVGALRAGLRRMQEVGGAAPGDRTMIDALAPAMDALEDGLGAAARSARSGAEATAGMTRAKAGRASYVGADKLKGHADPGAEAVARLFEGLARG